MLSREAQAEHDSRACKRRRCVDDALAKKRRGVSRRLPPLDEVDCGTQRLEVRDECMAEPVHPWGETVIRRVCGHLCVRGDGLPPRDKVYAYTLDHTYPSSLPQHYYGISRQRSAMTTAMARQSNERATQTSSTLKLRSHCSDYLKHPVSLRDGAAGSPYRRSTNAK